MVRQLLAIANLDSTHEVKRASVNIGDLIKEVIDALPASDRKAEVEFDPALKSTVVIANRELLLVAIRNLQENAVRHMLRPGIIRWSLEKGIDTLAVCIDDDGPGGRDSAGHEPLFPRPQQECAWKRTRIVDRRSRTPLQRSPAGPAKPERCVRSACANRLGDRTRW